MSFTPDLPAAARRHLLAADALDNTDRRDVAGYLYGIAAECAIKALMQQVGLSGPKPGEKDPYYLHFPELRTVLQNKLQGRISGLLLVTVSDPDLFKNWNIKMRYSSGKNISRKNIDLWRVQARRIVGSIGT